MFPRADLALYDRNGQLTALAEIKKKPETSREWAAQLRRNMLAHGGLRSVPYFLLITPDRLYIWKDAGDEPVPVEPTYVVSTPSLLQPYFDRTDVAPGTVSGPAFELIVGAWLADLLRLEELPIQDEEDQGWLLESGLFDAVKQGRIEYDAAA